MARGLAPIVVGLVACAADGVRVPHGELGWNSAATALGNFPLSLPRCRRPPSKLGRRLPLVGRHKDVTARAFGIDDFVTSVPVGGALAEPSADVDRRDMPVAFEDIMERASAIEDLVASNPPGARPNAYDDREDIEAALNEIDRLASLTLHEERAMSAGRALFAKLPNLLKGETDEFGDIDRTEQPFWDAMAHRLVSILTRAALDEQDHASSADAVAKLETPAEEGHPAKAIAAILLVLISDGVSQATFDAAMITLCEICDASDAEGATFRRSVKRIADAAGLASIGSLLGGSCASGSQSPTRGVANLNELMINSCWELVVAGDLPQKLRRRLVTNTISLFEHVEGDVRFAEEVASRLEEMLPHILLSPWSYTWWTEEAWRVNELIRDRREGASLCGFFSKLWERIDTESLDWDYGVIRADRPSLDGRGAGVAFERTGHSIAGVGGERGDAAQAAARGALGGDGSSREELPAGEE